MNIHGINLLFLLLPIAVLYGVFTVKNGTAKLAMLLLFIVVMFFVPFKIINSPNNVRVIKDKYSFDRHSEVIPKVEVEQESYEDRLARKEKEMKQHSAEKLTEILGE